MPPMLRKFTWKHLTLMLTTLADAQNEIPEGFQCAARSAEASVECVAAVVIDP